METEAIPLEKEVFFEYGQLILLKSTNCKTQPS